MASDYSVGLVQVKPVGTNSWVKLPTPSDYKMTSTTLVDSARNTHGFVVATVVREGIRKLELTWNYLDQTQFSLIAKLFETSRTGGNGNFSCYLYYYDTIRGVYVQSDLEYADEEQTKLRTFYVGDRVSDTAKIKLDSNGKVVGYANVKLSLIEM